MTKKALKTHVLRYQDGELHLETDVPLTKSLETIVKIIFNKCRKERPDQLRQLVDDIVKAYTYVVEEDFNKQRKKAIRDGDYTAPDMEVLNHARQLGVRIHWESMENLYKLIERA